MKKRMLNVPVASQLHFTPIAYVLALLLIAATFMALLSLRMDKTSGIAMTSLLANEMTISRIAKSAVANVTLLRDAAQLSLRCPHPSDSNPLLSSLKQYPKEDRYQLDALPQGVPPEDRSYITGGGRIPLSGSDADLELDAAIRLNPVLSHVKDNVPQAAWIYYYSKSRFISMYPYENQSRYFTWSDAYLNRPLFQSVTPAENPDRVVRWIAPYIDAGGKGLVTTVAAPVYDEKDRFRGMVGLDITLETTQSLFNGTGLAIGTSILVDNRGQVLARPAEIGTVSKDVHFLQDVLPPELKNYSDQLLHASAGRYNKVPGWQVYILNIQEAPWRLIFLVDSHQFLLSTLQEMGVEAVAMLLLTALLFFMHLRQRMALRLRTYKAAVDSSLAPIMITDRQGRIQYVNQSFSDTTGYSREEAVGQKSSLLKSGTMPPEVYADLQSTLQADKVWKGELLNRKRDGSLYWDFVQISPVPGIGNDGYYVAVMEDITEKKHLVETLSLQATTDPLTGASNRRLFMEQAEKEMHRAMRYHKPLSVLLFDIDHFKQVNDRYGHEGGDAVLLRFTSLCETLIRQQDLLSRLGGEEFAILLPEVPMEGARVAAERIRKAVEEMETPSENGQIIRITCSVGISERRSDDTRFQQMLSRADIALYQAKSAGRNRVIAEKPAEHPRHNS